jgi:hypothetical protein
MTPRSGTRLTKLRALGLALGLSAFAFAGCKQGVGDRCQVDTDCDDTLVCVIPSGASLAQGGSCQPVGTTTDGGSDGATSPDAGEDMAMSTGDGGEDMATADLASADMAAAPDLATQDGAGDAGNTD